MANIRFEWDEKKNLANQRKHGISFEQAIEIFDDQFYVSLPEAVERGEERWQTFGMVGYGNLLMVVHTTRDDFEEGTLAEIVRIISARFATSRERKRYENENG